MCRNHNKSFGMFHFERQGWYGYVHLILSIASKGIKLMKIRDPEACLFALHNVFVIPMGLPWGWYDSNTNGYLSVPVSLSEFIIALYLYCTFIHRDIFVFILHTRSVYWEVDQKSRGVIMPRLLISCPQGYTPTFSTNNILIVIRTYWVTARFKC